MAIPEYRHGDLAYDITLADGHSVWIHLPAADTERYATWTLDDGEPVQLLLFDDAWDIDDSGHFLIWVAETTSYGIRQPVLRDFGSVTLTRGLGGG